MNEKSTCPNCESESTTDYLFGDTEEYAFTVCNDCEEEFTDEGKEEN